MLKRLNDSRRNQRFVAKAKQQPVPNVCPSNGFQLLRICAIQIYRCHRSLQNQPRRVESKPATPRSFIHNRFFKAGKGLTGRSYRLKDHAAIAGKEDKTKKTKSKSNEPSTAEPAS